MVPPMPPEMPAVIREIPEAADSAAASTLASPLLLRGKPRVSTPALRPASKRYKSSRKDGVSDTRVANAATSGYQRDPGLLRVEDVPRPWVDVLGSRAHGGRITDRAGLIDNEGRAAIMQTIRAAERETGTEMMVVTLPSIGQQSPKQFATALFNQWGIGHPETNNGVLVLVVRDQKRVEVEVGEGVERQFSKSWTEGMIEDKVLPAFQAGKFSRGLERCVDACAARLSADTTYEGVSDVVSVAAYAVLSLLSGGGSGGSGGSSKSGGGGSSSGGGGGGGSW